MPVIVRAHGTVHEASATASYPHDDCGHGIRTKSGRHPDQMRPRCGRVQDVDFPHTATAVAPDSPQGTRWASRAHLRTFTFSGRWAKIAVNWMPQLPFLPTSSVMMLLANSLWCHIKAWTLPHNERDRIAHAGATVIRQQHHDRRTTWEDIPRLGLTQTWAIAAICPCNKAILGPSSGA